MSDRSTCHCGEPLSIDGICPHCPASAAQGGTTGSETASSVDYDNAETIDQLLKDRGTMAVIGPPGRRPTDQLGRYPVTGILGEGGMGQVLQVRDDNLGREMAAKVIKGRADPQALDKFIREAQVTGQLEHPNIVPTYELGMTPDKRVYFTMKRVQGKNLADLLNAERETEGALLQAEEDPRPSNRRRVGDHVAVRCRSLASMLQIFLKVCDAMSFAHSRDVIHRDLKPDNIMVGQFGEVQVMDWGLARLVGQPDTAEAGCTLDLGGGTLAELVRRSGSAGEPLKTLDGMIVGTPYYMAPEQARGEVRQIDRRADIYALGATLYQMLTLERPFAGASAWSVLRQVVAGQLIPPSQRKPEREVPFELEAVVLKAMAPSPRDRYDTVDQMKQEIEAYLEGRLLQAAEYSTWQVLKKWGARHQAAAAAAAGILLSMIVAFGVIIWQLGVVQEERDKANKRELQAQLASKQAQASEQAALEAVEEKNREARRREATDLVRKAMELYTRKGDRDKVIAYLTEAAQSVPHHPGLLRLRGRMALDQEKWPQAKELLERALRQDASDYLTHFLLYRWYAQQEQGNTSAAQTHVIAASKYGTRDSAIGLWAHGTREWGKAEKLSGSEKTKALGRCVDLCTQALAKQSDFVWALMFRGYSYKELERWNKALADHKAVIELTSGSAMAYYNRGRLYTKMKRCQEALADFSTAIGVDPLYAGAYINRGDLHRRRKWYAKALADFDEAIRLAPRDAEGYSNRGLLHKEMKWYAKALADLDNAIRIAPRSARAYTNRGNLYRSIKEHAKALADFSQAIRIDPQLAKAHFNRGTLHQAMKRYDQALADFDQAIRLAPRDAEGYNNRGNLHRLMKRYDKALADYAKVIRIDPRHARAYFNRGNLYQSLKQPAQAIADYGHAIRIDPRHAQAFNYRGFLLYRQGRYRLAVADWQRALSLLRGTAWEDKLIQYIRQARSRIK